MVEVIAVVVDFVVMAVVVCLIVDVDGKVVSIGGSVERETFVKMCGKSVGNGVIALELGRFDVLPGAVVVLFNLFLIFEGEVGCKTFKICT